MTRDTPATGLAEYMLRRACRRVPGEDRDERYAEWAAEIPAIRHDPDIRSGFLRCARVLGFAAGTYLAARRLYPAGHGERHDPLPAGVAAGSGRWASRSRQRPATLPRLPGVLPAVAGVVAFLCLVFVIRSHPVTGSWNLVYAGIAVADGVFIAVNEVRLVLWVRRRRTGRQ